jgi:hypothetical protein
MRKQKSRRPPQEREILAPPTPPTATSPPPPFPPEWFEEDEAAAYIGMSVPFLAMGRITGDIGNRTIPPPYYKLGKRVKYRRADLDAWLAERRVERVKNSNTALAPTP